MTIVKTSDTVYATLLEINPLLLSANTDIPGEILKLKPYNIELVDASIKPEKDTIDVVVTEKVK